jgi:cysteine desulfurase/selenocysteine lyase
MFDVYSLRKDFPILCDVRDSKPLVFLDSAASSQRPTSVIEAMNEYYRHLHANVHRGVYHLAENATEQFEAARKKLGQFLNAFDPTGEIIFTKNATEAINLVAHSWAMANLKKGDKIVLSEMEHHANIVPWQIIAKEKDLILEFIPIDDDGKLILDDLDTVLSGAKLLAITMASNVLGTLNPVKMLAEIAHQYGALFLVDAAQYAPHFKIDVQDIGCDFLALTGHKMLGPTGIGALWARAQLLEDMPPFIGGGEMISEVTKDGFLPNEIPWKFEAGTPAIAEAIGLSSALDYLGQISFDELRAHELELTSYALGCLEERFNKDITIYGPSDPTERCGIISFNLNDIHPHDVAQVLDADNVCVRAGHHCAKPLMKRLDVMATTRASFYLYNIHQEVDILVESLAKVLKFFS